MEYIDEQLSKAYQDLIRLEKVELMIDDLDTELSNLKREVELAKENLDKENADVEKISGNSLSNILFSLIGKLDSKLEKEEAEALAAKLKYNQYLNDISEIESEIAVLSLEKEQLKYSKNEYKELFEKKKQILIESNSRNGERILSLYEDLEKSRANQKEIDEAIHAGELAMDSINSGLDSISSAQGWGVWDMLGGGILSTAIKHSHIDDANYAAMQVQAQLRGFKTELADVKIDSNINIEISGFATFADYFFDGIISDWFVQSEINNTHSNFLNIRGQVAEILKRLEDLKEYEEENEAYLKKQIDDEILKGI